MYLVGIGGIGGRKVAAKNERREQTSTRREWGARGGERGRKHARTRRLRPRATVGWACARMFELLQDHDLHAKRIKEVIIIEFRLIENLDGSLSLRLFGDSLIHGRLCARTEHLLHLVALPNFRYGDVCKQVHTSLKALGKFAKALLE